MDENKRPPSREAVALEYEEGASAPRVIASGKGVVAENIISKAKDLAIPIYEDPDLAHTLNLLRIGDEIPPELYNVVARVLVFIGDMDRVKSRRGIS